MLDLLYLKHCVNAVLHALTAFRTQVLMSSKLTLHQLWPMCPNFLPLDEQKSVKSTIDLYSKRIVRQYLHKPTHHIVIEQRQTGTVLSINRDFVAAHNLGTGLWIICNKNGDFVQSKAKGVVSSAGRQKRGKIILKLHILTLLYLWQLNFTYSLKILFITYFFFYSIPMILNNNNQKPKPTKLCKIRYKLQL